MRLRRATPQELDHFGGERFMRFQYASWARAFEIADILARGHGFRWRVRRIGGMWEVLPS